MESLVMVVGRRVFVLLLDSCVPVKSHLHEMWVWCLLAFMQQHTVQSLALRRALGIVGVDVAGVREQCTSLAWCCQLECVFSPSCVNKERTQQGFMCAHTVLRM